jgi:hypothetical protein
MNADEGTGNFQAGEPSGTTNDMDHIILKPEPTPSSRRFKATP